MTATLRVWATAGWGWAAAAFTATALITVAVAWHTSAVAALPLLGLAGHALTSFHLPDRRPARVCRAAAPVEPTTAPGARRTHSASEGWRSGCAPSSQPDGCRLGGGPAAALPRTPAAGPTYRAGRAPVPGGAL